MIQIFTNIGRLATCARGLGFDDPGLIDDATLVVDDKRIDWLGPTSGLPWKYLGLAKSDLQGALVVPGLVDCHTHLAFGGWRDGEFALRCRGATYQEIAAAGGGIMNTVKATRAASESELFERASSFLKAMNQWGVTTVEAKSGYGLTVTDELKLLRVYQRLLSESKTNVATTFLGAHTMPPEFKHDRASYVRLLIDECLPIIKAERLAHFCDVFVEEGAFTADEARALMTAAKGHGLRPKLHVDQLSDGNGAALAAEVGAISADHLEYTNDAGIEAMAKAGVVAVALPIASMYLRQPFMDSRRFHAAGVPVAVATDFNPGTAPCLSLPMAMNLACTQNRMTPGAALRGATIVAAQALGLEDYVGSLEVNKWADFVVLSEQSVDAWLYHFPPLAPDGVFAGGECIYNRISESDDNKIE